MTPDDPKTAALAIDAMRRGWPVCVTADDEPPLFLLAVESATHNSLAEFEQAGNTVLMLSHERAATLNIVNQRAAASGAKPVFLARPQRDAFGDVLSPDRLAQAMAIADPARDLAYPMKGPFDARLNPAPRASAAAIDLVRRAGLLPAFVARIAASDVPVTTSQAAIAAFGDPARLKLVARARLPISAHDSAEIIAFRSPEDPADHVALIIGTPDGSVPLVRLHSECLTGDVFGSLKCDCGPQLHHALARMADAQWGVLLYLRQEGRGIGLINKLRAYQLQDQGFDTVDANVRLGFPVEARDFGIAATMLRLMHIDTVRLLTNNPDKVERLTKEAIDVVERVPHILPANLHNATYLATKRDRTGHDL